MRVTDEAAHSGRDSLKGGLSNVADSHPDYQYLEVFAVFVVYHVDFEELVGDSRSPACLCDDCQDMHGDGGMYGVRCETCGLEFRLCDQCLRDDPHCPECRDDPECDGTYDWVKYDDDEELVLVCEHICDLHRRDAA